jgi:RNase P/RNase MRP subunit POP5
MRFKRRYFCIECIFNSKTRIKNQRLTHSNLYDTIVEAIEKFYGDFGVAYMLPAFSIVYLNAYTNIAIIRISRKASIKFRTLWLLINNIEKTTVFTRIIYNSGSILKAKKFLTQYCYKKLSDDTKPGKMFQIVEESFK